MYVPKTKFEDVVWSEENPFDGSRKQVTSPVIEGPNAVTELHRENIEFDRGRHFALTYYLHGLVGFSSSSLFLNSTQCVRLTTTFFLCKTNFYPLSREQKSPSETVNFYVNKNLHQRPLILRRYMDSDCKSWELHHNLQDVTRKIKELFDFVRCVNSSKVLVVCT